MEEIERNNPLNFVGDGSDMSNLILVVNGGDGIVPPALTGERELKAEIVRVDSQGHLSEKVLQEANKKLKEVINGS